MNKFVNFKKRSITLPVGCKDLMDVLQLPHPPMSKSIHGKDQLRPLIKPQRFESEGLAQIARYVRKFMSSRGPQKSLLIASLDYHARILLHCYALERFLFPLMGIANNEQGCRNFFQKYAIAPNADYLMETAKQPGAGMQILAYPLPSDTSVVTQLTTDLMRSVYALNEKAGLEFTYWSTASLSEPSPPLE